MSWNIKFYRWACAKISQPPCEAVSWNEYMSSLTKLDIPSASLWGCELKLYWYTYPRYTQLSASLWGCELKYLRASLLRLCCGQPPCEAVSWNVKHWAITTMSFRQPPCEAVSWNLYLDSIIFHCIAVSLLVRLWVEIFPRNVSGKLKTVSLLVRLWVEMHQTVLL